MQLIIIDDVRHANFTRYGDCCIFRGGILLSRENKLSPTLKYLLFVLLCCPAYACGQSGQPTMPGLRSGTDSLRNPLAYTFSKYQTRLGSRKGPTQRRADEAGPGRFTLPANTYNADISYIGYVSRRTIIAAVGGGDMLPNRPAQESDTQIRDVVITGSGCGADAGKCISAGAMNHIQPSASGTCSNCCPADGLPIPRFLLEPYSSAPRREFRTAIIRPRRSAFRSSWTESRVERRSMAYNSGTATGNNISLNGGVDMRTMPTDEIASVEIQQGIPSVGIRRPDQQTGQNQTQGGRPGLEARFRSGPGKPVILRRQRIPNGAPGRSADDERRRSVARHHADPRNTRQLPACDRFVAHEETLGRAHRLSLYAGRIARLPAAKKRPGHRRRGRRAPHRTL